MKHLNFFFSLICFFTFKICSAQNPLYVPDTLNGTNFNLAVQSGTQTFFSGYNTKTYGYNGNFLGPTLLINKDDSITLNVVNTLTVATTVHWHGFHVAPYNDGGPHEIIAANGTWSPSFKVRNNAGTYWYHPHGAGQTERQISKGLAGMIIIRDTVEKKYSLPRKYGMDDFPLIVQTKAFDGLYQFSIATQEDSVLMVNGTLNPFLTVPKQVVRLRLLSASAGRTYNFGLSDSSTFYLIASDGGMLSVPLPLKRLQLSTGERAEILIDFGTDTIGQQVYLRSYSSELPRGILGADSVGTSTIIMGDGYYSNKLNGADFDVLRFDVATQTSSPVTTIPTSFAQVIPIPTASATVTRSFVFFPDTSLSGQQGFVDGPFFINGKSFAMDSINVNTYLNNVEIWDLVNRTMVAHPFHIHDVQFFVVDINGNPPPPELGGIKDVILVKPNDTVRFITQFLDFVNDTVPYMFHCHLLHHEDDGMMGAFVVRDSSNHSAVQENILQNAISVFPNPSGGMFNIDIKEKEEKTFTVFDMHGKIIEQFTSIAENTKLDLRKQPKGIYLLKITKRGSSFLQKLVIE